MQIKGFGVNAASMLAAGKGAQENSSPLQTGGSLFGPACRVTISRTGKNLSGQQTVKREAAAQSVPGDKEVRMLLRHQKEADLEESIREGYRRELNDIEEQIKYYNTVYARTESERNWDDPLMKETVEELRELQKAMLEQKQLQMEESQRRMKAAQQMAVQSGKYQNEIDENNRDLLAILKTIEAAEKAENGQDSEGAEDGSDSSGTDDSVKDVIQGSALQFMTSSAVRDRSVEERMDGVNGAGHWFIDAANAVTQSVLQKCADIKAYTENDSLTDEQIGEMMQNFRREMTDNYQDVKNYGSFGIWVLQQVQDLKLQRIADDPMRDVLKTKEGMMQAASDAVIGEAWQSRLEEGSQKLAEEVEELIDERDDLDETLQEKIEEEQEKIPEELLQPGEEEEERLQEQNQPAEVYE